MSDAISPAFDAGGKYLYFLASTNVGPQTGWLEMSSIDRPMRRSSIVAVLSASEPSPFLPESGDEPGGRSAGALATARLGRARSTSPESASEFSPSAFRPGTTASLVAGPAGTFFYSEPMGEGPLAASRRLIKYQLKDRTAAPFLEGIRSYTLSADKKKLLYGAPGARWGVVATDRPARVGDGPINVAQLETWVDPRAEWAEIFKETWRIQRDYFYDAKMHGADWNAVYKKYSPLLPYVGHRNDLGYLIALTGGELTVGHSYLTGPGDEPDRHAGAGRHARRRLHRRERTLSHSAHLLRRELESGTARAAQHSRRPRRRGRLPPRGEWPPARARRRTSTACSRARPNHQTVHSRQQDADARGLAARHGRSDRERGWAAHARVGRAQPSTSSTRCPAEGSRTCGCRTPAAGGYTYFTRYYYAQQEKDGAVIDERYNQGGQVADYIVNELDRKPMGYFAQRDGKIVDVAGRRHLRSQGHDHQRVGRLGRRRAAVLLPAAQDRPAGRHAHVGRPGRHARRSHDDRRRRHHGAEPRVLQPRPADGRSRTKASRPTSRSSTRRRT